MSSSVDQTPLVPETLLKKRKSTEKSREEKRAAALEARKLSTSRPEHARTHSLDFDLESLPPALPFPTRPCPPPRASARDDDDGISCDYETNYTQIAEASALARKAKRAVIFKRAEQYVNEYNKKEREEIRLRRQAKANGDFYVPAQPKVYFVMRIKGINNIAPKPRKILQLLRLLQINNGVFVKVTKATSEMLLRVEPYITYGEPNLKTIRELVYKRGYGKVNKQRVPLSSNQIIEENLGQYGILSIEDVIHEISTAGPHFKQVSNFLWPFKLSNPNGGFRTRKAPQWIEGGEAGKREQHINALVRRAN
ncbi:hypothetical protein Rhopal_005741-T1 [Rhodotorula paludigena]|uniref:60S ribosomal protein L7 n=1 Tax=Rhodotorula paludigena TaxID=86838 RepID=A0AAV5GK48_9BASI|nr:hypothetical protein Rhopal_005741-T1 [Rhodotorula paludigena]